MVGNITCHLKALERELSQSEKQATNPLSSYSNNQAEDIDEETERTKTKTSLLVQNQEIRRERGIWYNIKILMVDDSFINIYVDDMLRMQIPIRNSTSTSTSFNYFNLLILLISITNFIFTSHYIKSRNKIF